VTLLETCLVIFVEAKKCCIEAEVYNRFWKVAIIRTGLSKLTENLSQSEVIYGLKVYRIFLATISRKSLT
jgi:hypothetical protein